MEKVLIEANRCLSCPLKPCKNACPLGNDMAGVIALLKEGKAKEAYTLLSQTTLLPYVCGKVCPHSKSCQSACLRARLDGSVKIGEIESALAAFALDNGWQISKKHTLSGNVAVVGGGPAGLTCAGFLAREGINVTIFEKHDHLGGLLWHGIPEFRLERAYLQKTIDGILALGVKVEYFKELGRNLTLAELEEKYDAVFLSFGANKSLKMGIKGENLEGVFGANEFLEFMPDIDFEGKTVIVNGGGNVAIDTARTIARKGGKVKICYRRSENEMPAERYEIAGAKADGVDFLFLTNIVEVLGQGRVNGVKCLKTKLVQKDESRPSPVDIEGSDFVIPCDYLFIAIGSEVDEKVVKTLGLKLERNNRIANESSLATVESDKNDNNDRIVNDKNDNSEKRENNAQRIRVFVGGDLAFSPLCGRVASAARSGRDGAEAIIAFFSKN